MEATPQPRVVLVHDWLTGMRGGEKCLEVFCRLWPQARLYTLLHRKGSVSSVIEVLRPRTSFLQRLPGALDHYRYLLPLMPLAVGWRLPACDVVLSSSHCVAKAVQPPDGTPHVCYCHTPMRYAWQMRASYLEAVGARGLKARLMEQLLEALRRWDRQTAQRVTYFLANSRTVQARIRDCYGRESTVIYPPVDTDFYTPAPVPREDYYLLVSAFAPYKRLDLALAACRQLGRRLVIIGQGQEEKRLRALAGPDTHFLGWQENAVIRDHYRRCRALLFPGEEDFGIVPVEAQACGTPVIALGKGGATETVLPPEQSREPTGIWFAEQSLECLIEAIERFERQVGHFSASVIRRHARRFHARRFAEEIADFVAGVVGHKTWEKRQAA
jgi:glycosyltransferase involved in cell wall biosynthesis